MSTVYELEQQLRIAKEKEKAEELKRQFEENKAFYEGKAFASHKLASSKHWHKAIYFTMIKLCNFRENDNSTCLAASYLYDEYHITINKDEEGNMRTDYGKYTMDAIDRFRGRSSFDMSARHTIPGYQFDIAFEQAKASKEVVFDTIRAAFKTEDYITGHANTADRGELEFVQKAKVPLIDLTAYTQKGGSNITVLELLSYNHHPFVISKHLINNSYSKQITRDLIDKIKANASGWGGSVLERDLPRIALLENFYNSVNWLD